MPEFWQFPTVSMGLGPLMAIYQARFMKYLTGRGISDTSGRRVWAFMGDGEMDEPESMGAIGMAGREHLDNLVFVINCNLQRLDGPVRGNGKIIQELETNFRGAGWNVVKVIWGNRWDPLLEADHDGRLVKRMEEAVDGDYQTFKSRDGAYVREHFFGKDPELAKMVEDWSDADIWTLNRGGHDPRRSTPRTPRRVAQGPADGDPRQDDQGLRDGRGRRGPEHHPPAEEDEREALFAFRDRFELDLTDDEVREIAFHKPADDSPEMTYLRERRASLGGSLPQRRTTAPELAIPS
jgi:pyruvate dehydrogenase E1 component